LHYETITGYCNEKILKFEYGSVIIVTLGSITLADSAVYRLPKANNTEMMDYLLSGSRFSS